MLNWIASYTARWSGWVAGKTIDLVHWGLHAVAGVVYAVFGNVGKAWLAVVGALHWAHQQADGFAWWVVQHFDSLLRYDLPRIIDWAAALVQSAEQLAARDYSLLRDALAVAVTGLRQLIAAAVQWVTVHVYDPLLALCTQLRADLLKWGYWAYQLLNDPPRLAQILLDAIVAAAEAAFWRLAGPAGQFALRLVLANARRFAQLAETILAAVL